MSGTHCELEHPGCATTSHVRNCCTNWLSSVQHRTWVSRSIHKCNTTLQSWISQNCLMRRPFGSDTSKLLVYSGLHAGRDVPNANCSGSTTDACCSKVTTQLERSEKLRYIDFSLARKVSEAPWAWWQESWTLR
jgi:hypothetical protein